MDINGLKEIGVNSSSSNKSHLEKLKIVKCYKTEKNCLPYWLEGKVLRNLH